jgi:hypothetical protein
MDSGPAMLPADVKVEPQGLGDERHVLLDIEGSKFELRADEAIAIGQALTRVGSAVREGTA